MTSHAEKLLSATDVRKSFGFQAVLKSISIAIQPRDRILLLGANGAGKTTLLRILAGISQADGGTLERRKDLRIGYASAALQLYPRLTVMENLSFFSKISGAGASITSILDEWGLGRYRSKQVVSLSKGNQWRVALARTFLVRPQLVMLDEPTSNLDDDSVGILLRKMRETALDGEGAVVLASHDIARVSASVSRVISIHDGCLVSDSGSNVDPGVVSDRIAEYRLRNR